MKIIVPAIGSRGDVQPYIALCQGLQQAGHEAILATNPTLAGLAGSYGIKSAPVGPPVDMGLEGARIWEKSGKNFFLGFMRTMRLGMRLVEQSYPDILQLCRTADLVITTDISAGAAEADTLGLPWASVTLQPDRIPVPDPSASWWSLLAWKIIGKLALAPLNRLRRRVGAPPLHGQGLSAALSDRLILLPVSPHVAPPKPGWPACAHQTGYWNARSPRDWSPPPSLHDFLEAGDPPVVISLGAMSFSGAAAQEAARITLEAVRQAGVRAVVQGWDEPLSRLDLPSGVYHAGSLPHTWLFPRACAVVHHGGFGTTASALSAGIPAVVVPHIIDQIFWAQRVHQLGTGPKPIPRAELTAEKLAERISQAVADPEICQKAARLGIEIRSEPDGVIAAVRCIEAAVQ
jgi:UDP:flavonoid glycosyltransferase YjiC (YdhE family)